MLCEPSPKELLKTGSLSATMPGFYGLRGVACLMVLLGHYFASQSKEYSFHAFDKLGVCLFFSLSGFLLAWNERRNVFNIRHWVSYTIRRFSRIYPTYFAVVLILAFTHDSMFASFPDTWLIAEQHLALIRGTGRFWTVPTEVHFYVVFPLIVVVTSMFTKPTERVMVMVLYWIWLLWQSFSSEIHGNPPIACLTFFVGGILGALIVDWQSCTEKNHPTKDCIILLSFMLMGLGLCVFPSIRSEPHSLWQHAWFFSPLMIMIMMSVHRSAGAPESVLGGKLLGFVGRISYCLYLVADSVVAYFHAAIRAHWLMIPFVAVLALTISWVLHVLIEMPFYKCGRRISFLIEPKEG